MPPAVDAVRGRSCPSIDATPGLGRNSRGLAPKRDHMTRGDDERAQTRLFAIGRWCFPGSNPGRTGARTTWWRRLCSIVFRHLRPVELFRNSRTRPYGIGAAVLLGVGAGVAAVFSVEVGLGMSIVLIVFLLTVLVDFLADNEENQATRETQLVGKLSKAVATDDADRQQAMADLVVKATRQAPGVIATYSEMRDVPFVDLLRKAGSHEPAVRQLELVSWYFGYFVEGARFVALRDFFGSGGKVEIVVPDVSDTRIAASVAAMRSSELDSRALAHLTSSSVRGGACQAR